MCRELAPEKDALFVEQLLVEQVVRLVGLTEGIEACIANLLDTRANLFRRKGVAITQEMLVFAGAIDEDWLFVEKESRISGRTSLTSTTSWNGPRNATDAEGCTHLIESNVGRLTLLVAVTIVVVWSF